MMDVAHAAGVSQPTVSRVLQDHPNVREEVRIRVRDAVARLNYRPNSLVSALMTDLKTRRVTSSTTLAYISAFDTPEGWRNVGDFVEYFEGAKERAEETGYALEHFWLKERGMTGPRLSRILFNRGIPGMIVAPLPRARGHLSMDWPKFATVALGFTLNLPDVSRAMNDQFHTMLLVLRKLRWMGYRKMGLIMQASSDARVNHRWVAGFLSFRLDAPPLTRIEPHILRELTEENVVQWYLTQRPDVIVGADDRIVPWLRGAGIEVPAEVGFAHLSVGPGNSGQVAGTNQNSRLIGASAVDMVVGQLHRNERGIPVFPKLTFTTATWVDGPTVRKLRPDRRPRE